MTSFFALAKDAYYTITSCLCSGATETTIKLNGRTFNMIKLLGEGGFSYVYLVEDTTSQRRFALKKIRVQGSEQLRLVLKEVEASKRFRHQNCIRCLDSCVGQEKDGSKIVYLFLPYYPRGNLQDAINSNAVNRSRFSEKDMLQLFLGTCEAVRAMHTYVPGPAATYPPSQPSMEASLAATSSSTLLASAPSTSSSTLKRVRSNDEEDDETLFEATEQAGLIGEGDHRGGEVEDPTENSSAFTIQGKLEPNPKPNKNASGSKASEGEVQPWAHRDIKPANVMVSEHNTPVLMDFGSCIPARIPIPNRSVALAEQDRAAEHSTMPYRAPELFDVKTNVTLDEKVDIWSLGCTLFAMAYGTSPFETNQTEQGGSVALAVMSGGWKFPANDKAYSQGLKDLISAMLSIEPGKRPDIHRVIQMTMQCQARLQ